MQTFQINVLIQFLVFSACFDHHVLRTGLGKEHITHRTRNTSPTGQGTHHQPDKEHITNRTRNTTNQTRNTSPTGQGTHHQPDKEHITNRTRNTSPTQRKHNLNNTHAAA
jgi:hypothetical protein